MFTETLQAAGNESEYRQLEDSELELVSGGMYEELKAACDTLNVLMGITTTLMNAWGQQLMGAARKA